MREYIIKAGGAKFILPLLMIAVLFVTAAAAQNTNSSRDAPPPATFNEREFNRTFKHQTANVNGIKIHYVAGGTGKNAIVLLHGFPQTWYEWRGIMPALAKDYTVIAVDLRGAGDSDKPNAGYDKRTMASDVRELVRKLGFAQINLVGHDIGLMVAYAYAAQYPFEVKRLAVIDAPLPGTKIFEQISHDPRAWHFGFNSDVEFATELVKGREGIYLQHFFDRFAANKNAITKAEADQYTRAYSQPNSMRFAFEWYRAFTQDTKDNGELMKARLKMPILAMNGEAQAPGQMESYVAVMMREVADDVRGEVVPNAGHWLAEESPAFLVARLLTFFDEK